MNSHFRDLFKAKKEAGPSSPPMKCRVLLTKFASFRNRKTDKQSVMIICFVQENGKNSVTKLTSFEYDVHRFVFSQVKPGQDLTIANFARRSDDSVLLQRLSQVELAEKRVNWHDIQETKLNELAEASATLFGVTEPINVTSFAINDEKEVELRCLRCNIPCDLKEDSHCQVCFSDASSPYFGTILHLSNGGDGIGRAWAPSEVVREIVGFSVEEWQTLVITECNLDLGKIKEHLNEKTIRTDLRFVFSFNAARSTQSGDGMFVVDGVLHEDLYDTVKHPQTVISTPTNKNKRK
jgi:hypothetical protein